MSMRLKSGKLTRRVLLGTLVAVACASGTMSALA